jgi:hypothetical protein
MNTTESEDGQFFQQSAYASLVKVREEGGEKVDLVLYLTLGLSWCWYGSVSRSPVSYK